MFILPAPRPPEHTKRGFVRQACGNRECALYDALRGVMRSDVSIAIETTCRAGGLALGLGDELREAVRFDASRGHATHLISLLRDLLARAGLRGSDVTELYVSIGPGSFTGTRVAVTVARTMGQVVPDLGCVAVPTLSAIAENALDLAWRNLAVILDARDGCICAGLFGRDRQRIVPAGEPEIATGEAFLAAAPRPLLLIGEGLEHHDLRADGVESAPAALHLPEAEGAWRVGRRMARAGQFTPPGRLLPVYLRKPSGTGL